MNQKEKFLNALTTFNEDKKGQGVVAEVIGVFVLGIVAILILIIATIFLNVSGVGSVGLYNTARDTGIGLIAFTGVAAVILSILIGIKVGGGN